ncbi:hypothetical protein ACQJ0K_10365 [Priestia megaterium]
MNIYSMDTSGIFLFSTFIIDHFIIAKITFDKYNSEKLKLKLNDSDEEKKELEDFNKKLKANLAALDSQLLKDLKMGLNQLEEFVHTLKIHLDAKRFEDNEIYKRADASDLKWVEFKIMNLRWLPIKAYDICSKHFKFMINKRNSPNLQISLSFKFCIALCTLLLLIPIILIFLKNGHESTTNLSGNILRLIIPGTLGLLGLVITSTTFMANFYKDNLKIYKLPQKRKKQIEDIVKATSPEEIYKLTDNFLRENAETAFDALVAQNISKNLYKLVLFLLLFVIISLISYMLIFIDFNFNTALFFALLLSLSLLFTNILFTILFIIKILTNQLLFNDFLAPEED